MTAVVREVIDMFGPRRAMFASNFPVDRFTGVTMAEELATYVEFAAPYSDADRAALFHDTAVAAYGLAPPAAAAVAP